MLADVAIRTLTEKAEAIKDTDHHTLETCSPGDAWAQGDVAIIYMGNQKPQDINPMKKPNPQLAPGTTKGSRHILENLDQCKLYEAKSSHPLVGPFIEAPKGVTVSHPEHGNITMNEPGWYGIRYQQAYAEEIRRVQD